MIPMDTCFLCVYSELMQSHGAWSEMTPGDDFVFQCRKGHFRIEGADNHLAKTWAEAVTRSRTCSDAAPREKPE